MTPSSVVRICESAGTPAYNISFFDNLELTSASTKAAMSSTVIDGSTSSSYTLSGAMIVSLMVVKMTRRTEVL